MADMFNHETLETKLQRLAESYKKRFGDLLQYDYKEELVRLKEYSEKLQPYIVDQVPLLKSAKDQNLNILVEGANAIMLDIGKLQSLRV